MPLTAKAKNLLIIIQNVILFKIDILAKTTLLYCITLDVSCGREGGWRLPLHHRLPAGESASLVSPGHSHTANKDIDTMLA